MIGDVLGFLFVGAMFWILVFLYVYADKKW